MTPNPFRQLLIAAMLVTALTAESHAATGAYPQARLDSAIALLQTGNDDNSIEKAADEFQQLLQASPADPLLLAYSGASTARLATTTIFPWKKMHYAEDGLAMLDKALQSATANQQQMHRAVPVALEIKLVAANTFLAVPGFMNRAERGEKLLNDILQAASFPACPAGFRDAVQLRAARLAIAHKQPAAARGYLDRVIHSGGTHKAEAEQLLKGLPS